MALEQVAERGLVLLGCGKMGSALLSGWLDAGLPPASVWVLDPNPSDWLRASGVQVNQGIPSAPAVALLAVKPQMMGAALPALQALGNSTTLVVSIAAGTSIASFEAVFGPRTPIVRTMPNTPAMVGRGITGIVGNAHAGEAGLALAEELMRAVGQVVTFRAQIERLIAQAADPAAWALPLRVEALTLRSGCAVLFGQA